MWTSAYIILALFFVVLLYLGHPHPWLAGAGLGWCAFGACFEKKN